MHQWPVMCTPVILTDRFRSPAHDTPTSTCHVIIARAANSPPPQSAHSPGQPPASPLTKEATQRHHRYQGQARNSVIGTLGNWLIISRHPAGSIGLLAAIYCLDVRELINFVERFVERVAIQGWRRQACAGHRECSV